MTKIEYKQLPKEILCFLMNKQIVLVEYETQVSEVLVFYFKFGDRLEVVPIDYGFALRYHDKLDKLVEEVFI